MSRSIIRLAFVLAALAWVAHFGLKHREELWAKGTQFRQQIAALLDQDKQQNAQKDVEATQTTGHSAEPAPAQDSKPPRQETRTGVQAPEPPVTEPLRPPTPPAETMAQAEPPSEPGLAADTGLDGGLAHTTQGGSEEPWDIPPPPGWGQPSVEEILQEAGKWLLGPQSARR